MRAYQARNDGSKQYLREIKTEISQMKNKITEIENVILWKKKNKADKSLSRLINGERQLNSKIRDEKSVQLQVLERLKGLQ